MKLWRNPAFGVFWLARTISFAGTGITTVVLPVLVFKLTGAPAAVAALNVLEVGPYIAFGLLAGALADRLNRKIMMVACDGAAALLLAAVPAAAALHMLTLAQLLIVALGVGTAFVWFDAANFGSIPALVDREQLPTAVSFIWITGSMALLGAPALGAALVSIMPPPYVLGFDAVSYLMSALLLLSIRRPFRRPQHQPDRTTRIRADIAEGLRYLWHQPVIKTMTLAVFCACVSWGGTFGLLVVYANRALHMTHVNVRLGLLYTAGELGGLVSSIVVPRVVKRLAVGRLMAVFLAANVLALVLLATAPSYGWAIAVFCCYELVYTLVTATGITVRQMLTPDHLQSRVNTTGRLIAYGGQPVGAILGGTMAQFLPIRLAFGILAISVAVGASLAVWSCLGTRPLAVIEVSAPLSPS
ncbi:MAG TPA: MFS transporter [Streptosporangiaceae bacterium]